MSRFGSWIIVGCGLWLVAGMGCEQDRSATTSAGKSASEPTRTRIALLMKARTNPFFDRMASGAENAAAELGVSLEVLAIDKETDTEKQASQVETVVSKGVRAILIAPADSRAIIAPLLQAQARGIHIINLDNRIDADEAAKVGLKIAAFIGPDNAEGARKSTRAMIDAIGGEGKVAMLEGIRGVDNAEQRKAGFLEAVKATDGKVRVVAMDTAEWATEPAQRKMEGILSAHPDLEGVFCANDMMALGAIQAIASAGKTGQVVVTAYDNLKAAQQAIHAGTLHATIEQHPDKMGAMGVRYALKLIHGESIPSEIPVPTDLMTAADLRPDPTRGPAAATQAVSAKPVRTARWTPQS